MRFLALLIGVAAAAFAPRHAAAHSDPAGDVFPQVQIVSDGFDVWYFNNLAARSADQATSERPTRSRSVDRRRAHFDRDGRLRGDPRRTAVDEISPKEAAQKQLDALRYAAKLDGHLAFDGQRFWRLPAPRAKDADRDLLLLDAAGPVPVPYDLGQHSFLNVSFLAANSRDIVFAGQSCDFDAGPHAPSNLEGDCPSGWTARMAIASMDKQTNRMRAFTVRGVPIAIWGMFPVAAAPVIEGRTAYLFWIEDADAFSPSIHMATRAELTAFDLESGAACDASIERDVDGNSTADMKIAHGRFFAAYHSAGIIHVASGLLRPGAASCEISDLSVQRIPQLSAASAVP